MTRMPACIAAAGLLAATCAHAQPSPPEVIVAPVESMDDFVAWVKTSSGTFPRLGEAVPGKKVWFPIVVSGLHPPAHGELRLVADMELVGPDGKSLAAMPRCCSYTIADRPDIRTALLAPAMNVEFDRREPKGVYTVRASVSDGTTVIKASNTFRLGGPAEPVLPGRSLLLPSAKEEAGEKMPVDVPPGPKRTFRHADRSDCLDLPTREDVIRCAEKN